jgi:hypothetical protein
MQQNSTDRSVFCQEKGVSTARAALLLQPRSVAETANDRGSTVHYSNRPGEKAWVAKLFSRLLTCFVIEQIFDWDNKIRLQLDLP